MEGEGLRIVVKTRDVSNGTGVGQGRAHRKLSADFPELLSSSWKSSKSAQEKSASTRRGVSEVRLLIYSRACHTRSCFWNFPEEHERGGEGSGFCCELPLGGVQMNSNGAGGEDERRDGWDSLNDITRERRRDGLIMPDGYKR